MRRVLMAVLLLALLAGGAAGPANAEEQSGALAGRITDEIGLPLEGICVLAYGSPLGGSQFRLAFTDDFGQYVIDELPPGDYYVTMAARPPAPITGCTSEYAEEYYPDTYYSMTAELVTVHEGLTTFGIDASLKRWARISGRLTSKATGAPLANICVRQYTTTAYSLGINEAAITDANGHYELTHVVPEATRVLFGQACGNHIGINNNIAATLYSATGSRHTPTTLHIASGGTYRAISEALPVGGRVRGRVVDRAGRPIAGLTVFLEPHVGSHSDAYLYGTVTWTDEDGRYRFRALPSSGYSFRYDGRGNWHHYYLNKTLAYNATVVPVHVTESYRLKRQVVKRPS